MITTKGRPRPAFTKERFYVDHMMKHGMATMRRHINRYKWAASHLTSEMNVLDAGCGSGYGDYILLNNCKQVIGIDQSQEAIDYASFKANELKDTRVKYYVSKIEDYIYLNSKFDAIVCIEVIEHLKEKNQELFLNGIRDNFWNKDKALLLMTTPIKQENKRTEYHEHEFTESEYRDFLRKGFHSVQFENPEKWDIKNDFLLAVCRGAK